MRVTDEEQAWINAEFNCGVEQTNERLFIGKSWNCCTGDSPHAPYSASKWLLQAPAARPRQIHLAESPAELELLQTRSGPFIPFLQKLNVYDGAEFIEDWQLCIDANIGEHPVAFIHGNYLPLTIRFAANHTLVVCPRTHAAFGHPRHPFPHFFRQGVRIALGTDSLASNPDLDILAEAVVLRQHYPEVPAHDVLRMITINAAEALGWGETCGTLASGKPADFTVIPLPNVDTADPHDLLFQADLTQPRRTLFNGEWR
jgi:cytosine/adenosine deaminase-related metal-dependent hydrolase